MLYDHRTRLAIFDIPLAQKRRNSSTGYGVRSSRPPVRGDVLAKEALGFKSFVHRICSAFKRYFLLLQYPLLRIHCCCVLVLACQHAYMDVCASVRVLHPRWLVHLCMKFASIIRKIRPRDWVLGLRLSENQARAERAQRF